MTDWESVILGIRGKGFSLSKVSIEIGMSLNYLAYILSSGRDPSKAAAPKILDYAKKIGVIK